MFRLRKNHCSRDAPGHTRSRRGRPRPVEAGAEPEIGFRDGPQATRTATHVFVGPHRTAAACGESAQRPRVV